MRSIGRVLRDCVPGRNKKELILLRESSRTYSIHIQVPPPPPRYESSFPIQTKGYQPSSSSSHVPPPSSPDKESAKILSTLKTEEAKECPSSLSTEPLTSTSNTESSQLPSRPIIEPEELLGWRTVDLVTLRKGTSNEQQNAETKGEVVSGQKGCTEGTLTKTSVPATLNAEAEAKINCSSTDSTMHSGETTLTTPVIDGGSVSGRDGKTIDSNTDDPNVIISTEESTDSSHKAGRSSKNEKKGKGADIHKKLEAQFREHWSIEKVKEALAKGDAFEGKLQISAFHTDRAYVMPVQTDPDIKLPPVQVKGFVGRNRALQGDSVVAIIVKDPPKKIKTKEKHDASVDEKKPQVIESEEIYHAPNTPTGVEWGASLTPHQRKIAQVIIEVLELQPDNTIALDLLGSNAQVKAARPSGSLKKLIERCPEIFQMTTLADEKLSVTLSDGPRFAHFENQTSLPKCVLDQIPTSVLEHHRPIYEELLRQLWEQSGKTMDLLHLGRSEKMRDSKKQAKNISLKKLIAKCPELMTLDASGHAVRLTDSCIKLGQSSETETSVTISEETIGTEADVSDESISQRCAVVHILERKYHSVVGVLRGNVVQPNDARLPAFQLSKKAVASVTGTVYPGSEGVASDEHDSIALTVQLKEWQATEFMPRGKIKNILGKITDMTTRADTIAAFYKFNPIDHSEKMELEALEERDDELERKDLRSFRIFTVDPPHAKDLDDALSVEVLADGDVKVGVHIADVSHYVRPGSLIDREARRRLVTLYMVNKIYPMLPRSLADNWCSLLPNVDRKAFSVFYIIKKDGTLSEEGREFMKSTIHSNARWSYKEVDDALASDRKTVDPVLDDLRLLNTITMKRRETRLSTGGITLKSRDELQFQLDDAKNPIGLTTSPAAESPSHTLIEELMVLCNHVVAQELLKNQGGLLRTHKENPDGPQIILDILGKENAPPDDVPRTTRDLLDWIENNKADAHQAICFATLQNQGFEQAEYENLTVAKEHWALNYSSYLHFTSPIRRYADLIVHRLLVDQILKRPTRTRELNKIAEKCNTAKRNAFDASNDCVRWNFSEYLRNYHENGMKMDITFVRFIPGREETEEFRSTKPAVEIYIPTLGETKSLSCEQLNLPVEKASSVPALSSQQAIFRAASDKGGNWTVSELMLQ